MNHELNKVDEFFGMPIGTTYTVLIDHANPSTINSHIAKYGIMLDEHGFVPVCMRTAWKELMREIGVSSRYWKEVDKLITPFVIDDLYGQENPFTANCL